MHKFALYIIYLLGSRIFVDVLSIIEVRINLNFQRLVALTKFVGISILMPLDETPRRAEIQPKSLRDAAQGT